MAGGADSVREIESEEPPGPQPFRYPPAQPFTEPDWVSDMRSIAVASGETETLHLRDAIAFSTAGM